MTTRSYAWMKELNGQNKERPKNTPFSMWNELYLCATWQYTRILLYHQWWGAIALLSAILVLAVPFSHRLECILQTTIFLQIDNGFSLSSYVARLWFSRMNIFCFQTIYHSCHAMSCRLTISMYIWQIIHLAILQVRKLIWLNNGFAIAMDTKGSSLFSRNRFWSTLSRKLHSNSFAIRNDVGCQYLFIQNVDINT